MHDSQQLFHFTRREHFPVASQQFGQLLLTDHSLVCGVERMEQANDVIFTHWLLFAHDVTEVGVRQVICSARTPVLVHRTL